MRLGYDTFIKEKLKSVLKHLAILTRKFLRSTKHFVSVGFCIAHHGIYSLGLRTARAGTTVISHMNLCGSETLISNNRTNK